MHKPKYRYYLSTSIVILVEGSYIYMKRHQIDCMYDFKQQHIQKNFQYIMDQIFLPWNFTVFLLTPTTSHKQETFFPLYSLPSEWKGTLFMGDRLRAVSYFSFELQ